MRSDTVSPAIRAASSYRAGTAQSRFGLERDAEQLAEWVNGTLDGSLKAAHVAVWAEDLRAALAQFEIPEPASLDTDTDLITVAHLSAMRLLDEAARLLIAASKTDDLAEQGLVLRKAGRSGAVGLALLDVGNYALETIETESPFVLSRADVLRPPADDPLALAVNESTQADADYAANVASELSIMDIKLERRGRDVVLEAMYDQTLYTVAASWADAIRTAQEDITEAPRPESMGLQDAMLRNAMWLYLDATLSLASVRDSPTFETELAESALLMQQVATDLRSAASLAISAVTGVDLPVP